MYIKFFSYNTIKGDMTGIVGEVWTLVEPLTTITWNAPRGVAPQYEEAVRYEQKKLQVFKDI